MTVLGDLSTAPLDSHDVGCPYRGLMPYLEADSRFFFGRLDDTRVVVDNLRAYPTTVLFGPSGVGKSSLLRAGVVRRLRDGDDEVLRRYGARETVVVCVTHWRDDAGAVVAQAIHRGLSDATGAPAALSTHELDAESVVGFCDQHSLDLLLILDQFEEYCYYHPVDDVEQAFVSELAVLVDPRTRCDLLISIREDAVAALDRFEGYLPGLLQNNLRLDHLDDAAGREAILRPVEELNRGIPVDERWDVEPALVDELLDQVRAGRVKVGSLTSSGLGSAVTDHGRIEAPFLQLVLTRLWEEEARRESRSMRAATLRELGGAEQIVREHLDRVLEGASAGELAVIAAAFGYLVTPSGTKIAHTSADLALMTGTDRVVFDRVMQRLTSGDRRILRQVPPPVDDPHGEPRYEVFHDVLGLAASDWRSRYLAAREGEETERRLVAERNLARDEARDSRRRLVRARAVLAGTAVLAVACLLLALLAVQARQDSAERLSSARQNRALVEAAETGQVDPGDALERVLATYRALGAGDAAAATALRTAIDANTERLELRMGSAGTHVLLARILSDGQRLVTVSDDGHVRVWHTSDGRLLSDADVRGQLDDGTITGAEVVPDGSGVVVVADSGATALVPFARLDVASGPVRSAPGDPGLPADPPPGAIVGRELSSGAEDGYVYLAASGETGRPLVATFGPTRPAEVWDADGNLVFATENAAAVAALDPSGGYLASWSHEDGQVRVHELSTGAEQATRDVGAQWVSAMAVRSDGQVVFADTRTMNLRVWDWRADVERDVILRALHGVNRVTWSGDEDFLLVNADKRTEVVTFDGDWRATVPASGDWAEASRLSPDGAYLAVGAGDGVVSLYRSEGDNAGAVTELRGHQGAVIDVGFSPDGQEVVTAGWDGTARVWSLPEQVVVPVGTDWVLDATFSNDGQRVATITSDHIVKVFDVKGETLWEAQLPWSYGDEQGVSLGFAPDGTSLVAAATDVSGPVILRGPDSLEQLDFPTNAFGLASVCWSDDGATIAAGGREGSVGAWSADGQLRWDEQSGRGAVDVACMPGGDILVGTQEGVIEIRDGMTGEVRREVADVPVGVRAVAASRDGDWVAATSDDQGLRVWSLDNVSGEPDLTVIGHDGTVAGLAFSGTEDETPYVATTASDGGVRVYDVEDGSIVSVAHVQADAVNSIDFHPLDQAVFVTASDDGTAVIRTCDLCGVTDRGLEELAREDLTTVRTAS